MKRSRKPSREAAYVQRLRKRLETIHGTKCQNCGNRTGLEMAHIAPTQLRGEGRGRRARLLDAIRNPHAYSRLCSRCHREMDACPF